MIQITIYLRFQRIRYKLYRVGSGWTLDNFALTLNSRMYPPLLASFTPALISCMGPPSIARSQMNRHSIEYMCAFSFLCTITSSAPLPSCFPGPITQSSYLCPASHPESSTLPPFRSFQNIPTAFSCKSFLLYDLFFISFVFLQMTL